MLPRQPHSPVVGANAAKHSVLVVIPMLFSKIHKRINRLIRVKLVAISRLCFGPLSGSNHAMQIIEASGYVCGPDEKVEIAQFIKDHFADRRKGITDAELVQGYWYYRSPIKAASITYAKDQKNSAQLLIKGQFFDEEDLQVNQPGANSALAALHSAVEKYFPGITVLDYFSDASNGGDINAKCQTTINIKTADEHHYQGTAMDSDIEMAALHAFIDAINQAYIEQYYKQKEL